ncbi:MAG: SMI1/KNR4 family protein, partial [Myxococcota bacterium]
MPTITRCHENVPAGTWRIEIEQDGPRVVVREGLAGEAPAVVRDETCVDEAAAAALSATLVRGVREVAPDPEAAAFLRDGLEPLLVRRFGVERGEPSDALVDEAVDLYGIPLPPELRAILHLRGSCRLGWCNFGEWRIWADDLLSLDPDVNLLEQLLTGYTTHALRWFLADLVPLGTAGNGDGYFAALDVFRPDQAVVYLFDHETGELHPFADHISSLAALNRLYVRDRDRDGDDADAGADPAGSPGDVLDALRAGMRGLERRVAPSWHYRSVVENSGVTPTYDPDPSAVRLFWFRGGWIAQVVEGDLPAAGRWFKPLIELHRKQMIWATVRDSASTLRPSRALYWLFTTYLLDRPELADVIDRVRASPSRLVRDAAALFAELAVGRTHVGALDLAEARRRFVALDLDPDRADQRAREAAEAEALRAEQRRAEREAATAFAAGATEAALADALWDAIDRPVYGRVVADVLAARDPVFALADRRATEVIGAATWEAALDALVACGRPEERAFLAVILASVPLHRVDRAVEALTAAERAAVVARAPGLVVDLAAWTRATYGREHALGARIALGTIDAPALAALVDRLRWVDERPTRADAAGVAGAAVEGSAFGPPVPFEPPASVPEPIPEPVAAVPAAPEPAAAEPTSPTASDDEVSDEATDDEPSGDATDDAPSDEATDDGDARDADGSEPEASGGAAGDTASDAAAPTDPDPDDAGAASPPEDPRPVGRPTPELDPEVPLVETPSYLRSITDKAPLRRVLTAIGAAGDPGALALLRSILVDGPPDVRPAAILALAEVPGDDARRLLEELLATDRRLALVALARRADPAALPAVEWAVARFGGLAHLVVFERTMREVLRGAAGRPVDLDLVRLALRTVVDNHFAAAELHEAALGLLGRHAAPDEVERLAVAFLDLHPPIVRAAAQRALAAAGRPVTVTPLDPAGLDAVVAADGLDGVAARIRDPRAVNLPALVAWAVARGWVAQLADPLVAAIDARADLPYYTLGYARGGYDGLRAMITALLPIGGPAVDPLLHRLRDAPSALLRKPFEYAREANARLDARGAAAPGSVLDLLAGRDLAAGVAVTEIGAPRFALGCVIHGIAFVGDRVVVVGGGAAAVFDRAGARLPVSAGLGQGWAYDVAHHPAAGVVVIGYSHGHCQVYDGSTFARRADLAHGGAGVRKVAISPDGRWLATACDDRTLRIWDLATLASVRVHREPYDVNAVGWLDDDRIAFATDQHAGVVDRLGGEAVRTAIGGAAELTVVGVDVLVGTGRYGLALLDPTTFDRAQPRIRWSVPVTGVARARLTADGRAVVVACWDGPHRGASRWDVATGGCTALATDTLFGLAVDPVDGGLLAGGNAGRAIRFAPDGTPIEVAAPPPGDGVRWLVPQPGTDAVAELVRVEGGFVTLDASGGLTRHDPDRGLAAVLAHPPGPLPRAAETATDVPDGVVVAAFDAVVRYGGGRAWSVPTRRCEQVLGLGDVVLAASAQRLGWLDAATGAVLDERDAGVASSWVEWILPVDRDRVVVAGYDDRWIRLWSVSERRVLAEHQVDHLQDDRRFARPYAMTVDRRSRRLLVSHWDNQIDLLSLAGDRFTRESTIALHQPMAFVGASDDGATLIGGHAGG